MTLTTQYMAPPRVPSTFRIVKAAVDATPAERVAQGFAAGDANTLKAAYELHGSMVFNYCAKTVGDAAADVTQEVFVAAWRNRSRYDSERAPLGAWLIGIARFKVLDHLRKAKAVPTPHEYLPEPATTIEDSADRLAQQLIVRSALDDLPEQRRRLVELAFFTDLTHQQISEKTGIPIGSVKSDIRRGLMRLRDILEAHDAERI